MIELVVIKEEEVKEGKKNAGFLQVYELELEEA